MSIAQAMSQGTLDKTCGLYFAPDYYSNGILFRLAYIVGWMRGAA